MRAYQEPPRLSARRSRPQLGHAAAGDVARADHEVGVRGGLDQRRDVRRVVREVGVHLDDELGAAGERVLEPGGVGAAEAVLLGAVEDLDRVELGGEPVGDLAGPVGRGVVDDEHPVARRRPPRAAAAPGARSGSRFSASL